MRRWKSDRLDFFDSAPRFWDGLLSRNLDGYMFALEKIVSAARMYIFIIACSCFHTIWISLLIIEFFELDFLAARTVGVICFVTVSGYALKVMPKELRKLEGK